MGFHSLAQSQFLPDSVEPNHLVPRTSTADDVMTQSLPPTLHSLAPYQRPSTMNYPNEERLKRIESQRRSSLQSREGETAATNAATGIRVDSGLSHGVSDIRRDVMYTRSPVSVGRSLYTYSLPTRKSMQCLRCNSSFSVDDLDKYEKHIKECYSDVQ